MQIQVAARLLLKVTETFSFRVVTIATNSPKNEGLGFLSPHRNCHSVIQSTSFPTNRSTSWARLMSTMKPSDCCYWMLSPTRVCALSLYFLTTFTRIAELWQTDCRLKQKVLRVNLKLACRTFSSICVGRHFLCLIFSCPRAKCRFTSHYPPAAIMIHLPTGKPWFYSWNSDFAHHSHWNNPLKWTRNGLLVPSLCFLLTLHFCLPALVLKWIYYF